MNWIQRLLTILGIPAGASISVDIAALQAALTALGLTSIEGSVADAGAAAADFDTDLTEASNDHYNGMILMFTNGVLEGQAHVINDYVGGAKNVSFSAEDRWTEAPGNGDDFIILPSVGTMTKAIYTALATHDVDIKALIATVQADLDNPDQYKANVAALATAAALTAAKAVIDAIKTILDTPADFMADVSGITAAGPTNIQMEAARDAIIAAIPAMVGTDGAATVADGWDAALATILDNFTAIRIAYLDELAAANIPADIDTLLTRLSAVRAGYLDELAAANLPLDIATILAELAGAAGITTFPAGVAPGDGVSLAEVIRYISDNVVAMLTLTETGGTLTANGAEQDIILVNAPAAVFKPLVVKIDLTEMAAGDNTIIRLYYRTITGGNLILQDSVAYNGAQTIDLKNIPLEANRYGFKVTLEQTAGVNRDYDWEYLYES